LTGRGQRAAPRTRAGLVALCALVGCGGLCALGLVAGWCGRAWWVLDLAAHFRVQQVAGLVCAASGLALLRAWRWSALFLACALLGGWRLLPYWCAGERPDAGAAGLRVASLNVEYGNGDCERVLRFVRESKADVLLLMEVSRGMLDALEPELRAFEHRLEAPRDDPFGIALYARIPMQAERVDDLGTRRLPAIVAELEFAGRRVRLVAAHVLPPISSSNATERDLMIEGALETLCATSEPGILLGDLNTTPWAETLDRLAFPRGLRDARLGQGILPSWPADSLLLRIPIDHCLVRGPWQVAAVRVGQPLGSDHLGLVVELALAPAKR